MTESMSAAEYQAQYGRKAIPKLIQNTKSTCSVKKGRSSLSEPLVSDSIETGEGYVKITLAGLIPGLNGKNGLMSEHWSKRIKRKKAMMIRLNILKPPKFKGIVEISFKTHVSKLSDTEDNLPAKRKVLYDCLVTLGIIEGDSPFILKSTPPEQVKSRRKDQRVEITIKSI